ncbi:MAG: exosortase system-associated protein, TIGR04073 family [Candidatus Omnitrophica bacterium]|nr:exosortase system-associated protein, TIGR04073 family [Candidatus Omnitrophota bacterium]
MYLTAARVILVCVVLMGTVMSREAFADDMWDKGGRGIADLITSPYEIIRQGQLDFDKKGGVGIFTGGFRGIGTMVGRMGVGAYELVTFPVPGYEPILDPEFIIPPASRTHADWGEDEIKHVY